MGFRLASHTIQQWNQRQTKVGKNGIKLCKSDIIAPLKKLTAEHNAGNPSGAIVPDLAGVA